MQRIYLIGMMGSGKSYLGKKLAHNLMLPFVDLDTEIEKIEALSIAEIFSRYGEAYFRKIERQILHKTTSQKEAIFATGGGTPCFFDNIQWINQNGISIFLNVPPKILAQRLLSERAQRPLLQNNTDIKDLKKHLEILLRQRNVFYQQAHIGINIHTNNVQETLRQLHILLHKT